MKLKDQIKLSNCHNFEVGMGVSLSSITLQCPFGQKTYPDGDVGYVFDVKSVPSADTFTTHVGISTVEHTYVSGGNAEIDVVRLFDGQVVYFDKLYKEVNKITLIGFSTESVSELLMRYTINHVIISSNLVVRFVSVRSMSKKFKIYSYFFT